MVSIAENILDLIGGTPLVKVNRLAEGCAATVVAKLEYLNPAGSVKDRIALNMVREAEARDSFKSGQPIVAAVRADKSSSGMAGNILEPTGGNTGVSLAMVSAAKGYKLTLTSAETVRTRRCNLLKAYGADLIFTSRTKGMPGAVNRAKAMRKANPDYFIPDQFNNPDNPKAHNETAAEIWRDTDGLVDIIIAGVGTGGTLIGISQALKKKKPSIKAIAIEPKESAVLAGGKPGPHRIVGLGAGFVPSIIKMNLIDEILAVSSDEAFDFTRRLAREEGILAGISSGAAVCGAVKVAKRSENTGKMIVVILPDSGERYTGSPVFAENNNKHRQE